MTSRGDGIEFRVLGPLEARLGDRSLPLGGAKQRAVLAALLLRAHEVVSVELLIDDVWGDSAPPSAERSLESYVSRIRQLLTRDGPTLERRGSGYRLHLAGARLDADTFVRRLGEASEAADEGRLEAASALAAAALSLWHGPALADVSFAGRGRMEIERLEESRLRALELRFDAELALGRHEAVVGELQALVGHNPYRERFVAQLMVALYRSGRHADALDAYERTRAALSDDLGLQPSIELRQLSGQIVRQDPELRRLAAALTPSPRSRKVRRRTRRVVELIAVAAGVAAVTALAASGSAPTADAGPASAMRERADARVALLVPTESRYPQLVPWDTRPLQATGRPWGFEMTVIVGAGARARDRIADGEFELVLALGEGPATALVPVARRTPGTEFVFVDSSLESLAPDEVPNVSAVRFAAEQTSELAGYLSALVPARTSARREPVDMVSVVAGRDSGETRRVVAGFERGVEQVRDREVVVRVDHVDGTSLAACERVANDQIDAGSDVLFVDAGRCGLGALAVARLRGVWGIGAYDDGVEPGPHVLAIFYKDYVHAIRSTLAEFARGELRSGEDAVLDLNDDYAVGIDDTNLHPAVPASVWSKVVRLCTDIRRHSRAPTAP